MIRQPMAGATYSFALPSGLWGAHFADHIQTFRGRIELPGEGVGFLQGALINGTLYMSGQGGGSGICWLWDGSAWRNVGSTYGVRPCAFGLDSLYWSSSPEGYTRLNLLTGEQTSHPRQMGSQGIRYVDGETVFRGDDTISDGVVAEFVDRGDVRAGQGYAGGVLLNGRLLEPGECYFIDLERSADSLAVAIVKFREGQSVLYWLSRIEVDRLPLPVAPPPVPVPVPPVPPKPEPKTMRLPDAVQTIVNRLYALHKDLANGDDEQRRSLTGLIAEQARFTMGPDWGWKKAGEGRPPSKDAIAFKGGPELIGWDLFDGNSRAPNDHPESISLAGQVFIEVPAINHLGDVSQPPDPPPTDPPPSGVTLDQVYALLKEVRAHFK